VTKAPAYYNTELITAVKSFTVQAPGHLPVTSKTNMHLSIKNDFSPFHRDARKHFGSQNHGATALSIMTPCIMTLSILTLQNYAQHNII
jgi:hypothetical protein